MTNRSETSKVDAATLAELKAALADLAKQVEQLEEAHANTPMPRESFVISEQPSGKV